MGEIDRGCVKQNCVQNGIFSDGCNNVAAISIAGDEPTHPFSDSFAEEDDQNNKSKIAVMASKFLHNRQASIKKTEPKASSLKPKQDKPSETFVDKFNTLPSSLAISKSGLKSKFSLNSFSSLKPDSDYDNTDTDQISAPKTGNEADSEHRTMCEQIEGYDATSFNRCPETERERDETFQKIESGDTRRDVTSSNAGCFQRMNRRGRGRGQGGHTSGMYTNNIYVTLNLF